MIVPRLSEPIAIKVIKLLFGLLDDMDYDEVELSDLVVHILAESREWQPKLRRVIANGIFTYMSLHLDPDDDNLSEIMVLLAPSISPKFVPEAQGLIALLPTTSDKAKALLAI